MFVWPVGLLVSRVPDFDMDLTVGRTDSRLLSR